MYVAWYVNKQLLGVWLAWYVMICKQLLGVCSMICKQTITGVCVKNNYPKYVAWYVSKWLLYVAWYVNKQLLGVCKQYGN